jgi:hypothetical protein
VALPFLGQNGMNSVLRRAVLPDFGVLLGTLQTPLADLRRLAYPFDDRKMMTEIWRMFAQSSATLYFRQHLSVITRIHHLPRFRILS